MAGLPVAACVTSRQKVRKALKDLEAAHAKLDERIIDAVGKLAADTTTMMAVLRDLFRQIVGLPDVKKDVVKRVKDTGDPLGKAFQSLTNAQQKELQQILTP